MFNYQSNINRSGKLGAGGESPSAKPYWIIPAHPEWDTEQSNYQAILVTDSGMVVDAELLDDPESSYSFEVMKLFICYPKQGSSDSDAKTKLALAEPCVFRGVSKPFVMNGKKYISVEYSWMPICPYEALMPSYQSKNFLYTGPDAFLSKQVVIASAKLWTMENQGIFSYEATVNTADKNQSAVGTLQMKQNGNVLGDRVLYRSPFGKLGPNSSMALISVQLPLESAVWPDTGRPRMCDIEYGWPAAISADGSTLYWLGIASTAYEGMVMLQVVFLTSTDDTTLPMELNDVAALAYGPSNV